jgi:hypothetical protein
MYSMKDAVMSHAQKVRRGGSTGEAIEFLELPNSHQYNAAGNLYLSALSIINAAQQSVQRTAGTGSANCDCVAFLQYGVHDARCAIRRR